MSLLKMMLSTIIPAALVAGPGDLVRIIRAPEPATNANFGIQVAVVQGHLVVSAPNDTVGGVANVGSVYRYRGISGQLVWRLANPDPNPGGGASDGFGGTMISVGGDILIGAAGDDPDGDPTGPYANAGAAYLVDGRTGAVLRKIPNPEPNSNDQFSYGALGTLGGALIVGAPFDAPGGLTLAGTVYVIDRMTGAVLMRIPHPEPLLYGDSDDRFGRSVTGHNGNILVGAPADDQNGSFTGGAYLLNGSTGTVMLRIPNPYPEPGYFSAFGYPVRSFGGKIVIGEPWHRSGGKDVGAVYVFDGQTGTLLYTIQHPRPMDQLDVAGNRASFGWEIAEHGGFLAVSAPQDDVNGIRDAGSVYVFDLNTGQLVLSIHNPKPVAYDYFGLGTFHGGQVVCRAHGKEVDKDGVVVMNAGEVYVYEGPVR